MTAYRKLASVATALFLLLGAVTFPAFAADTGRASIGFSGGGVHYIPGGISGIAPTLDLDFGVHGIDTGAATRTYSSRNTGGYVVANETGGASAYTVTLGLSSFDNGLEGASLRITPRGGLVGGMPGAVDKPYFLEGQPYVELEADGLSSAVMIRATDNADPNHTGLGRWGFNFRGDLHVFTNTIRAGQSRAIMTWDIVIS